MNYIPPSYQKLKESLSPEEREELEAEAERMYKEYKEQCKLGRKPETLGKFNPYELNFDFIESIPEDEWKELIMLYNDSNKGCWIWQWILYVMGILLLIQFFYYVLEYYQE